MIIKSFVEKGPCVMSDMWTSLQKDLLEETVPENWLLRVETEGASCDKDI